MITIKLFALLKDKAGRDELHIDSRASTVSELLKEVSNEYPALSEILSRGRVLTSVNQEFVKGEPRSRTGMKWRSCRRSPAEAGRTVESASKRDPFLWIRRSSG